MSFKQWLIEPRPAYEFWRPNSRGPWFILIVGMSAIMGLHFLIFGNFMG